MEKKASLNKDIVIEKLKNTEDGDRILAHYQAQSLKQKVQELETEVQNYQ